MSKCSYGRCGSFVRRCLPGLYCRVSGSVLRMPTIIRAGSSVRSISGSFDPESRIRRKGGGFLALQGGRQLFSRDSRPYYQRRQCRRSRGDRLRQCRGMRDFIMVTLGTGLGSGFVAGGRMIYGHDGMAGELGHVVVEPGGRQCGCGRRGCLETYVSATGAKRTAFELMARETVPSVLRDVPYDKFDARIITEAAQRVIRWRSRFFAVRRRGWEGPLRMP